MIRKKSFGRRIRKTRLQNQAERLEQRILLAADPFISELQASNDTTIADVDGDFSDWIEFHNSDTEPVDLGGWYITDDANDLTKWQFPTNTRLEAGGYQLVYASGKDRAVSGQELHANFRLSSGGEFVALVQPDGTTVSQSFDPFPSLPTDTSFGLAPGREVTKLIDKQHAVRVSVPSNDSNATSWFNAEFDDAAWQTGAMGVGYETLNPSFGQQDTFDESLGPEWTVDNPGAATVVVRDGSLAMDVPTGLDATAEDRGQAPIVWRDVPSYPNEPDLTPETWEVVAHVTQDSANRGDAGIVVYDATTNTPVIKAQYASRSRFEIRANDDRIDSVRDSNETEYSLKLVRDNLGRTWTYYFRLPDGNWRLVGKAVDGEDDVPVVREPKIGLFAVSRTSTMNAQFNSVEINVPDERPTYEPLTSLDVGDTLRDENSSIYVRIPFDVTGDPARFDELTANLRYDDGFRAYLNGQLVAEQNAPLPPVAPAPNVLPWNAQAVGTHGATAGQIPTTTIDLTDALGLLRQGENVLAIHGLNVEATDRDFFFDATLFASDFVSTKAQTFANPTPGVANEVPAADAPIIVTQQGAFFGRKLVELELAEPSPDLEIRYTLDGSTPTSESLLYTAPFALTDSAMLQAITLSVAIDTPLDPSQISSATFVAVDPLLQDRTSDIPIVILDTLTERIIPDASNSLTSTNVLAFEVNKATGRSSINDGIVNYLGRGGIRRRGSSTAGQAKPNLTFETWGASGTMEDDDTDVELLGFSAESDWVLHAPFNYDRAMIRNQLAFALSNQMGQWAPKTRAVEVYLNGLDGTVGEEDYMGVYVLMEKIKRGPDRLDISRIDPDDNTEPNIAGGYIWKIDRPDPDAPQFSAGGITANWVYPKSPDSRSARDEQKATEAQEEWVKDHFRSVQLSLRDGDIHDPNGYSSLIDVRSWVDHHLLGVLMDDVDAFALSTYLFKDRDGKVSMGPAWDFDRSADSLDDRDNDPTLWGGSGGSNFFSRAWYTQAFRDPGFWQAYVDRWTELRNTTFSIAGMDRTINQLADEISESQARNFEASVNRSVRPRSSSAFASGKLDGTWQGEVEHLRAWLHERIAFFDSTFTQPPDFVVNGEALPKVDPETGEPITGVNVGADHSILINPPTAVFFDDDAMISGEPGSTVARYFSPSDDTLGTSWTQPDFDDATWESGPLGIGFENRPDDFIGLIMTETRPAEDGTTVLMRVPFQVEDVSAIADSNVVLRMKYDDGFVAYLNGQEVWRQNIGDVELTWDARARSHRDSEAVVFEDFDLTEYRDLFVQGENILSIRAINSSRTSNDMLALPALVLREVRTGIDPSNKVYYTVDGTDPRGPDGLPSPSAIFAPIGQSLNVDANTRLVARNFNDVVDRGSESRIVLTDWSAPVEVNVQVAQPTVVVSEINYDPLDATIEEGDYSASEFEFVELFNPTNVTQNLVAVEFTNGIEFDFTNSRTQEIAAGDFVVVVANEEAFRSRYGDDVSVAGEFTGQLSNNGEQITLSDGRGETLFSTNYGDRDPWPLRAAGRGGTLELRQPENTPPFEQSKWYRWRGSSELGGSPGSQGIGPSGVVINEIIARTGSLADVTDSIELFNPTDQPIDIGGWFLSDSIVSPFQFMVPPNTVLAPSQYVTFDQQAFGFGLNGTQGDSVWLVQRTAEGHIAFEDDLRFGPTRNGESIGRVPNGQGRFAPLMQPTFGTENAAPRVSEVIVSEVQYHPAVSDVALGIDPNLTESDLEFVEIYNSSAQAVDLSGWRLRGGPDFEFSEGTILSPESALVVMRFDPNAPDNALQLAAFRAHYSIDESTQLVGGFAGTLNNSDDRIELQSTEPEQVNVPLLVQTDEVLYDDQAPWPTTADGQGNSLQRADATSFGNFADSFAAAPATPGRFATVLPIDFDNNGRLDADDIDLLFEQIRSPNPDTRFDLNDDGLVDEQDRDEMINNRLQTVFGDANLDGKFNSADLVLIYQTGAYEDDLELNSGWADGDWDGDGEFGSGDLDFAFRRSGYTAN